MTNLKPWPIYAAEEYNILDTAISNLIEQNNLLYGRAVFGPRNTIMLETLIKTMPVELNRIKHNCRLANKQRKHTPKGFRYPRWVTNGLNTIISLSDKINGGIHDISKAYLIGNWELIEGLTPLIHKDVLKIQQAFKEGPPPEIQPKTEETNIINEVREYLEKSGAWDDWSDDDKSKI